MKTISSNQPSIHLVIGPLLDIYNATTPITGVLYGSLSSLFLYDQYGTKYDEISRDDVIGWVDLGNGFYNFSFGNNGGGVEFITENAPGPWILSVQGPTFLPYKEDILVVNADAYNAWIAGTGAIKADDRNGAQLASLLIENQILANTSGLSGASLSNISQIGNIHCDLISGGSFYKASVYIKDIEVRDQVIYTAYKDPVTHQLLTMSQPFTQNIIIASGGDL